MAKFTASLKQVRAWSEQGIARRTQKKEDVRLRHENVILTLLFAAIAIVGLLFAFSGYFLVDGWRIVSF